MIEEVTQLKGSLVIENLAGPLELNNLEIVPDGDEEGVGLYLVDCHLTGVTLDNVTIKGFRKHMQAINCGWSLDVYLQYLDHYNRIGKVT